MDVVADAVDWIHDTFSDPDAEQGDPRRPRPRATTPTRRSSCRPVSKIRMRHPDGSAVDVDKAAFDATVEEVKNGLRR